MNKFEKLFNQEREERFRLSEEEIAILQYTKKECEKLVKDFSFLPKYGLALEIKKGENRDEVYGFGRHMVYYVRFGSTDDKETSIPKGLIYLRNTNTPWQTDKDRQFACLGGLSTKCRLANEDDLAKAFAHYI